MDVGNISIYEAAQNGDFELVKWIVEYSRMSLNEFAKKHRTVLHFAAISGHAEMFEYLTDRCGLNPLKGDEDLVTPWDIIHGIIKCKIKGELTELLSSYKPLLDRRLAELGDDISEYKKIENYLEKKYSHPYEDFYRNPIRRGFFPDPSICRVGEDYYMVNSSFIFFPCIPISHSRDLIHWKIIGHAITKSEWSHLDGIEGGRGYWAPDISFYEGRFYITATYRLNDSGTVYRRQIVVSSVKPEGPYTEPVFIDEDGIDPSIFNDDDGRRYMLLNRGARIFELDKTGTRKISEPVLLYYGSNKRAPEGPHIYKKDGYYYLLQAEGGTGEGHRVTVSRSRSLMGIYEPCPYNPIMRQEDEGATIQRCGHGDMVETPDGRWYMVYLCGRKIGDGYSILGRETALDPVTWTADGWPIVNNLQGPSFMQIMPFCEKTNSHIETDSYCEVSPCGIPLDYMTPRAFEKNDVVYDSDENGFFFCIKGSKEKLSDIGARNIVLTRQKHFSNTYTAVMELAEFSNDQSAGITGYYDENTYLLFGLKNKGGIKYLFVKEHIGDEDREKEERAVFLTETRFVRFTMKTNGLNRKFYFSELDENLKPLTEDSLFSEIQNVYYLCDEGLSKGKRFTGALLGMYVYAGDENELSVKFYSNYYKGL